MISGELESPTSLRNPRPHRAQVPPQSSLQARSVTKPKARPPASLSQDHSCAILLAIPNDGARKIPTIQLAGHSSCDTHPGPRLRAPNLRRHTCHANHPPVASHPPRENNHEPTRKRPARTTQKQAQKPASRPRTSTRPRAESRPHRPSLQTRVEKTPAAKLATRHTPTDTTNQPRLNPMRPAVTLPSLPSHAPS